jgi:hypothetical protein
MSSNDMNDVEAAVQSFESDIFLKGTLRRLKGAANIGTFDIALSRHMPSAFFARRSLLLAL